MKTIAYLGALIAITTVLFMAGMQATASMGSDSGSDSDQAENATKIRFNWQLANSSHGEWKRV